jgi:hypothetical protein
MRKLYESSCCKERSEALPENGCGDVFYPASLDSSCRLHTCSHSLRLPQLSARRAGWRHPDVRHALNSVCALRLASARPRQDHLAAAALSPSCWPRAFGGAPRPPNSPPRSGAAAKLSGAAPRIGVRVPPPSPAATTPVRVGGSGRRPRRGSAQRPCPAADRALAPARQTTWQPTAPAALALCHRAPPAVPKAAAQLSLRAPPLALVLAPARAASAAADVPSPGLEAHQSIRHPPHR